MRPAPFFVGLARDFGDLIQSENRESTKALKFAQIEDDTLELVKLLAWSLIEMKQK
jgi:hypothetical protein